MSAVTSSLPDLLARRLELVGRLSQATAAMQKLQQARAGAEMDAMRCEMGLGGQSQEDMARDLLDARQRVDESDRGMERCEAEIAALEQDLAETDRQIEKSARG